MERTHKFPNGQTLTLKEYLDALNYGTPIVVLRRLGLYTIEKRAKHIAELFNMPIEEAREEMSKWSIKKK